jgi:hypothetical protein
MVLAVPMLGAAAKWMNSPIGSLNSGSLRSPISTAYEVPDWLASAAGC